MLTDGELGCFAVERLDLRVSADQSESQRSSYFLQLPYHYALSVIFVSAVLHWLIFQSIFLLVLETYDDRGYPIRPPGGLEGADGQSIPQYFCGYSPIAIFTVFIVGMFFLVSIWAIGLRQYPPGLPLIANSSR